MTIFAIILLILLGLLLLLIEFVIIPGVTVAGIGGFLLLGASVYMAFTKYGTGAGFLTLAFVLVASPLLIYFLFKSKMGKKMVLESLVDGKVDSFDTENIRVGDTGKTIGRLAPSGKVRVNNEVVEAQSTGGYIDHNTDIRVLKILTNKIIVEPFKKIEK
jgi:membrane-bound ClpP family serine protease